VLETHVDLGDGRDGEVDPIRGPNHEVDEVRYTMAVARNSWLKRRKDGSQQRVQVVL